MSIIEQIKAKIERLYNGEAPKHDQQCNFDDGYFAGIDAIAQFIDALESEKPTNQDGLQEEIQRFLSNATKMDKGEWKGKYPISEMGFGVVARHFAQWGAEHLKK